MRNIDTAYFPGWTRKSVTFTIDDGNVEMDSKLLSIVKPYGILGTFNLYSVKKMSPDEFRRFYQGYEIANHCKNHPYAFYEDTEYHFSEEPFDPETSDVNLVYKTDTDGVYRMHIYRDTGDTGRYPRPKGWHSITSTENYIRFADETKCELEEIFGEGSVSGFAWPYGRPFEKIKKYLIQKGYKHIRKTGDVGAKTDFDMPSDRFAWSYNAHNTNLLEYMALYENLQDDGRLKFFSFGVHSIDFERGNNWEDLELFAKKYGNRPEDYYYATVIDIFEYEDALGKIEITDSEIKNPTEITLYIKVDGERIVLRPKSSYSL